MAVCIATWSVSSLLFKKVKSCIKSNDSGVAAVVAAIADFEDNISTGTCVVGRGGFPNAEGKLQCDAAIMRGGDHSFGAVAALEGVATPIRVAAAVLEESAHSVLVGEGAQRFAREQGFRIEDNKHLLRDQQEVVEQRNEDIKTHDTIGLLCMDRKGDLTAGVSTSGIAYKYPGRVGDSPLPGCGLYADNSVGAACATGDGDQILKFCPSHMIVMLMSQGQSPSEACENTLRHMRSKWVGESMFEVGLIALNNKGETGAATSVTHWVDPLTGKSYAGFPYIVWSEQDGTQETRLAKATTAV